MTEAGAITARTAVVFLVATWPRRILLALVLFVPVVVGAVGGFQRADPPPRGVEAAVVTDTGAYLVVPQYFFVSDQVDASLDDGERWVGAVVQITNQGTTPISVTFSDQTFKLPGSVPNEGGANPHEVLRLDTGKYLGQAQPGITYEVALLWRTTGLQDPPAELTLTMNRTAWTEWTIEAGYYTWNTTGHSYEVALPLGEAPASILEEEDE